MIAEVRLDLRIPFGLPLIIKHQENIRDCPSKTLSKDGTGIQLQAVYKLY